MEKMLNQEEINALLHAAPQAAPSAGESRKVAPFIYGKAAQISKQQVHDVSQVHEAFLYRLKNRLSAYLQTALEMNAMSIDEVPYADFISSLPQQAYLASLSIQPTGSLAVLSLDLPIGFAMIDLILGGNGKPEVPQRPTTEIEERVLQSILDMVCDELNPVWYPLAEVTYSFDQTQRANGLFRLMQPYEKILFLTFEIRLLELFGTLTLAFPGAASSLLLRKLARRSARNQRSTPEARAQIWTKLQNAVYDIEMLLPLTRIEANDLLNLVPGQTLMIQHRISQPAVLKVAGSIMFSGHPARTGRQRGGLISQKFPVPFPAERSNP